MFDGTIGEIRLFAGPFTPADWLECKGQELVAADYLQLFRALTNTFIPTTRTFRLPNIPDLVPGVRHVICFRGAMPSP